MVETITPVVHGGRARWGAAVGLHVAGAVATAAIFGAVLGVLGASLGAPFGAAGAWVVAGVAIAYTAGQVAGRPLPVPQLRRQVPDWWRTFFRPPVAAFLYGAGLGLGFLTFLGYGSLVAVAVLAFSVGDPATGALVVAPFGLARGLSVLRAGRVATPDDGRRLVTRLAGSADGRRATANALALAVVASAAASAGLATADAPWGTAAAAALAIVFGWSSLAKLLSPDEWRRTLAGRRLPPVLRRIARPLVPAAEAAVPLLVVAGLGDAAGWWAAALLAVFSADLVRTAVRVGWRVPCGCFGGERSTDVRRQLVRNVALGAAAAIATTAPGALRLVWPGVPAAGEFLPMVLATTGVAVAGWTAWRVATWLRLGRRA